MKCPYCAEMIPDDSGQCIECDTVLIKHCPFCIEKIPAESLECTHCDSILDGHCQ